MSKKINYADMYTLRKDGRYMGYYMPPNEPNRKAVYDKDPEKLYFKIKELEKPKTLTFGEVAEAWHDEHWEKISAGSKANYDKPFAIMIKEHGDFALTDVTAAEVNAVLLEEKSLLKSYKHAAALRSMYKQVFDYAIIQRYVTYNPVLTVKVPQGMKRTTRTAPENETVKIIKANVNEPFGLFPYLLLYTGFRAGEALALTWEDIDFKALTIKCNKSVDYHTSRPTIKEPKTKAGNRTVPLLIDLEQILLSQPNKSGYVFNLNGKLLTRSAFRHRWIDWCKSANLVTVTDRAEKHKKKDIIFKRTVYVPTLTAHQLRHGYATILYEAGIDELEATELMGHADISTTHKIYTHLRQSKRTDVANKLNGYFSNLAVSPVVKSPTTVDNA